VSISGATVSADGQSNVTDTNGNYSISIAPGTYTVKADATDYNTKSISGIVVDSGATVMQNFALTPKGIGPSIPEFPTVAVPVAAILGLVFLLYRKNKNQ
jgi:hypothetical protein